MPITTYPIQGKTCNTPVQENKVFVFQLIQIDNPKGTHLNLFKITIYTSLDKKLISAEFITKVEEVNNNLKDLIDNRIYECYLLSPIGILYGVYGTGKEWKEF